LGGAIPSPSESVGEVWEWMSEQFAEAAEVLIDDVLNDMLGTPTIENDGAAGVLGTPVDDGSSSSGTYHSIYNDVLIPTVFPLIGMTLGFVAIMALLAPMISAASSRTTVSMLGSLLAMTVLIVASWEFAAALHAVSDGVTQHLLPDGDAVAEEFEVLAIGPVAATLGFAAIGWVKAIALVLLHGLRHLLLYVMPVMFPVMLLMAYGGGHRRIKQIGSFGIWQYYALLVMNWPTALLLQIAYSLGWQIHDNALLNAAMTFALFFLAIVIPLFVSGAFALVGISMRGVVASTATNAARSGRGPTPTMPHGSGVSTRSVASRLGRRGRSAGVSARNRARTAKNAAQSRISTFRNRSQRKRTANANTREVRNPDKVIRPGQRRQSKNNGKNSE
jgi:hypothetical protein